jgi:4-hydroxy-tetrahydrodipicolinate reductase
VIDGTPSLDSSFKGGVNGDVATCAILINAIPAVVEALPGLRTMVDIRPPHCFK